MSFETIREGAREIFRSKCHNTFVKLNIELKCDMTVVKKFEEALYNRALSEGNEIKTQYLALFGLAEIALQHSPGLYPDQPVALLLHTNKITAKDAVDDKILMDYQTQGNREICRKKIISMLLKDDRLKKNRKHALELGTAIEKSCYLYVLHANKYSTTPCLRSWDDPAFVSLYSQRCGIICSQLDPEGSVNKTYKNNLIDKLLKKDIQAEKIGYMREDELCPKATLREREEIELRGKQKVDKKSSTLFKCPKCKERDCEYYEGQTRSLDESSTIYCTCLRCGFQFRGG